VILASLVIALWHPGSRSAFWQGIEGQLLDTRFLWRGSVAPPESVAILTFDDAAVSRLETFPPSRSTLAATVSALAGAGAKAVALDFLLVDLRPGDAELAAALSGVASVLGVAEASAEAGARDFESGGFTVTIAADPGRPLPVLGPAEPLRGVTSLGHVILQHDADGAVRRFDAARPLTTEEGVAWYPALAIASLKAADGSLDLQLQSSRIGGQLWVGETEIPLDMQGAIPLVFYGPSGTVPTYSVAALADADLEGKLVFLGATATGFGDRHATPFDAALPGVELHATLAANVIEQRFLRRDAITWIWDVALALVVASLGFIVSGLDRPWLATLATVTLVAALAAVLQAAFVAGWWLDATTAVLSLLLGVGSGAGLRLLEHRRRAANLALYQSPQFVDRLASAADPRFEASARPAVVLFVDVANFTAHSESIGPEGTAEFLRLFHGHVEQAVDPLGGIIAHFAGDGAMVVFGLPEPGSKDALNALHFIEALYATVRTSADWPGLKLRVGGHAGPVKTGVVGGRKHRQLTVSGDVVNTASRLQDFAKTRKAAIALSDALLRSSPETLSWAKTAGLQPAGQHRLRGRMEPLEIWTGSPF
jgi:adenylate cyclase